MSEMVKQGLPLAGGLPVAAVDILLAVISTTSCIASEFRTLQMTYNLFFRISFQQPEAYFFAIVVVHAISFWSNSRRYVLPSSVVTYVTLIPSRTRSIKLRS